MSFPPQPPLLQPANPRHHQSPDGPGSEIGEMISRAAAQRASGPHPEQGDEDAWEGDDSAANQQSGNRHIWQKVVDQSQPKIHLENVVHQNRAATLGMQLGELQPAS